MMLPVPRLAFNKSFLVLLVVNVVIGSELDSIVYSFVTNVITYIVIVKMFSHWNPLFPQ